MAFGFPAYHTEPFSMKNAKSSDLRVIIKNALNTLSWSCVKEEGSLITASTSINMRSWGEEIVIKFLSEDYILVTSKCAVSTQCFDWGKNKINVKKLIKNIEDLLTDNHVSLKKCQVP